MKCDLHRHLSGSISCEITSKVSGIDLDTVRKIMTYSENEAREYESFFAKFDIFNKIDWNREKIDLTIQDAVWNLKAEGIQYAEIKFTIDKYLKFLDMSKEDLIVWIALRFEFHAAKWGVEVDLVLALKHESDKEYQMQIADLIKNDAVAECVSGIDVVGNENHFNADFYKPIYEMWHSAGKACMIHVGEIYNPDNVREAIDKLKLDRICHGIAVADDTELAKITRDRIISFDICPTSNILTGVARMDDHPVRKMLENGFIVTIGTDDPNILDTNLDREHSLLQEMTKITNDELRMIKELAYSLSARQIINRKANQK